MMQRLIEFFFELLELLGVRVVPPNEPDFFETNLFFRHNDNWRSTWCALADNSDEVWWNAMLASQDRRKANMLCLLINSGNQANPVSIYKNGVFLGEKDSARIDRIKARAEHLVLKKRRLLFVTLFDDYDKQLPGKPLEALSAYFRDVHEIFKGLNVYYVIRIEANETGGIGAGRCSELAKRMKEISGRPVGTHIIVQKSKPYFPGGLDFFLVENSWDPHNGDRMSADKVVEEMKWAVEKSGKRKCIAGEFNINEVGKQIEVQRAAARGMDPKLWGVA
ncbi:MAG: hypothetical protein WC453_05045 [Patescibacteria group bacterium]